MTGRLVEASEGEWREFALRSPQASVFATPEFFADTGGSVRYWVATRGAHIALGCVTGATARTPWLSQSSLLLSPEEHLRSLRGSYTHAELSRACFGQLLESVLVPPKFSFHPSIVDTRGLQWALEERQFASSWSPRFTGLIHRERSRRRASLRRAIAIARSDERLRITRHGSVDQLRDVCIGAGIPAMRMDVDWIATTAQRFVDRGVGAIWVAWHEAQPQIRAAWVVLRWRCTSHLMFGAICGVGSARRIIGPLLHDAIIQQEFADGMDTIDLMGANDRRRSEYKAGWMTQLVCSLDVERGRRDSNGEVPAGAA